MLRFPFFLVLLICAACTPQATTSSSPDAVSQVVADAPLPDCEWCGAMDAPADLSWQTRIADESEAGEPLVISGTIYQADGISPAKDILVYAYHTNAEGVYPKKGDETGNGRRHGHLRGWVRTNPAGKFQLTTIKPASYPSRAEPAHIHLTISGEGIEEYWVPTILFAGDPLISEETKKESAETGAFSPILQLKQDTKGIWRGSYQLRLK